MAKNTTIHRIQIEGTSDLIKLRQELDGYQKSLKKVKQETKDGMTSGQAKKYQELSSSIKATRKELNQTEKSLKGMNTTSKKGIGFIGKMAGAFTVATLAAGAFQKMSRAVSQAIVGGVETFRKYEFAMSKVKAISGATQSEFLKLDKSAQDLGRSTFFTAEEVANLQLNFSKLGFTSTEVLKAQEGALMAATATGEDLARTATVIGSTIRGFGLDASEAGRVADVMTASFTGSALTLEKFQTAMTKVAPVAKILGMSLEDTTATLGVLTDSGIEASIAGTSLRNIFLKLGDPSSDLAKSIGFTVNSGEDMVAQFKRMKDEGVNVEKMLEIVDVRQVAAISTMIENIDVLERQIGAYEGAAGAAKDMADIVGDNLEGATKRYNSALQGLSIVLVDKIAPALTSVLEGVTKLITGFTDMNDVPVSERMEGSRLKMMALFDTLTDTNTTLSTRRKVILKINKDYKEYLPNLITEKDTFLDLQKAQAAVNSAMQDRITIMAAEELLVDSVKEKLERENELFDLETRRLELINQIASGESEIQQGKFKNINLTEHELSNTEKEIRLLKEKGKGEEDRLTFLTKKAQELGSKLTMVNGQIVNLGNDEDDGTGTGTTGGSPANTDADPVGDALKSGEFDLQESLLSLKQMFGDKEIETKAELNAKIQEMQLIHLESMLEIEGLSAEQRMALEQKVADIKVKNRTDELDAADKLKQKEVDRIEQMKETGKLLMQIGEAEGENSKIKAAGIKISQAAAVASGIQGLMDASGGIVAQSKLLFPANLIAMAATAAQVASVVSGIKGLMSGSDKFEQGGLTNGGMFKGASHANGGVKFAVGGRIHEAEGGEAIINKRSTAMFKPMLSAMNQAGGGVKFANGGFLSTGEKFAMGGEVADVQQMISGAGGSTQIVMVESDVTQTQGRVSNIESQATF